MIAVPENFLESKVAEKIFEGFGVKNQHLKKFEKLRRLKSSIVIPEGRGVLVTTTVEKHRKQ